MSVPIKPGFYWAKSNEGFKWWNLIVEIRGEVPYLTFAAWNRTNDSILYGTCPDSYVFGPEIEMAQ